MITIISGTNRKNNKTALFAAYCYNYLKTICEEQIHLIDLVNVPSDMYNDNMYDPDGQAKTVKTLHDNMMIPAEKFLFVFPEYNGSYPGALKIFIDACSVRELDATWKNKKAALIGIASGRAGNLRGMDQLAGVLNHLGTTTLANKLPISRIYEILENDEIQDEETMQVLHQQCQSLVSS